MVGWVWECFCSLCCWPENKQYLKKHLCWNMEIFTYRNTKCKIACFQIYFSHALQMISKYYSCSANLPVKGSIYIYVPSCNLQKRLEMKSWDLDRNGGLKTLVEIVTVCSSVRQNSSNESRAQPSLDVFADRRSLCPRHWALHYGGIALLTWRELVHSRAWDVQNPSVWRHPNRILCVSSPWLPQQQGNLFIQGTSAWPVGLLLLQACMNAW